MNVNQAIGRAGERWASLSSTRKALVAGGAAAIIIGLLFLGQWLVRDAYAPLFSDLSSEEAGGVIEKLDEMQIPYKVAGDGGTILVPEDVLYKTRLQLASAGVLDGAGRGFELFDETQLGTTDFERRLNYQRALQEELRRTISYLEEVEMCRVHLVLPEKSVFVEEEGAASASIVLDLKPFAQLKPDQVKGIIYLVSSSVENLPPENVNIIDTQGNILSEGVVAGTEGQSSSMLRQQQLQLKRDFEKNIEERVQRMLERIIGPGRAVVMVTADLNYDQRQVTRIEYGDDGVVRSEELVEKSSVSTDGGGGVPGSATNIGTYRGAEGGGQSSSTETSTTRNYEIDETQETVVYAPGELEGLSTSVAVDGDLDADEVDQIRAIVETAIGYRPERGDQINVVSRTFDRTHIEEAEAEMAAAQREQERRERIEQYITWGLTAAGIIVLGLILFFGLRRRRRSRGREEEVVPVPVSQMASTQEEVPERVPTVEEKERKRKYESIKDIAKENPEDAAGLIRAWLSEE